MQYFVIFCHDFCNLVPTNWVNSESKKVFWPPKHVKFNKHKMHLLQPNDDWPTYAYHKCLGPFGASFLMLNIYQVLPYCTIQIKRTFFSESLEIANQVEEYCINASTNEDTDDMCNKTLFRNNTEKKRKRKKPTYLSDTSDEDEGNVVKCISCTILLKYCRIHISRNILSIHVCVRACIYTYTGCIKSTGTTKYLEN